MYDQDLTGSEFLGRVTLTIAELCEMEGSGTNAMFPLRPRPEMGKKEAKFVKGTLTLLVQPPKSRPPTRPSSAASAGVATEQPVAAD